MGLKQILLVTGAGVLGFVLGVSYANISRHREERRGAAITDNFSKFCQKYPRNAICANEQIK